MEEKLVSRLQFLHMFWLARSSRYPLALLSGSEILGHIALPSSEFTATSNGACPGRQDQGGSTNNGAHSGRQDSASRPERERARETNSGEGTSLEDLKKLFVYKREVAMKILGVRLTTFKNICRRHGIDEWPYKRIYSGNSSPSIVVPPEPPDGRSDRVFTPADPNGENNPPPTSNMLSTNGREIEMVGPNSEPNGRLPNSFEDRNFQNIGNGSIAEFGNPTTFHDSQYSQYHNTDFHFPAYNETEAAGCSGQILRAGDRTPTERQDSRFVKLYATYGDYVIKLHLPLMPGIVELKQAVSKQLGLGLDSFKVIFMDEHGVCVLMTHDEEVRELLQLTSSENQVTNRLQII